MKQYTHDYTLVQEAESSLYSATRLIVNECYDAALERINEARQTLQQYLAKDNMVPDDDVENGWVKRQDAFDDDELDFIRDTMAELLDRIFIRPSVASEALAIINHCQTILLCPEFDSVEQFRSNKSNVWTEIKTDSD